MQGTYPLSYTPTPYTVEKALQLGQIHQAIHSNSVLKTTNINLDTASLDSPSGEDHNSNTV